MRQTATLKSLSGSLGTSVKIILTLLFLNFFTQKISAQITIDGIATDWGVAPFTAAHVQDVFNAGNTDNIFAGNEKDFFFAANWFWKLGGAKDKNEIANGAAALVGSVIGPSGQVNGKFLVFAGDRTSNNGDAQIGFWFFQDGTGPVAVNPVTLVANTFYPEKHATPAPGDILVLADFSAGGRQAAVTVLQWVASGGTFPNSNNHFNQIGASAAVGTNNDGFVAVPAGWVFDDKQQDNPNPTGQYSPNEFYEGYVDLSIFGANAIFCPSTWLLETRSTKEITSTLDDFVGGALAGAPSCSITGNATICQGSSTCFTASGGPGNFTYSWSGPAGSGFTATGAVICNLTAAGAYNVTVLNPTGCTSVCSKTLTVNNTPVCNILPGNQTICSYQTASFTATGGGTYLWSTGATTAVISNLTAAGTYSVTVTSSSGGCSSSCSRTLTVNNPPNCNILPGNQTICSGSSASFTATGGGTYLWSTGATSASISNITATGTYSVTVTSAQGCTSSCSRTLLVNETPSCNILPANQTICSYQTASFTATGGGTYLWSTGATTAVISNLTASGTYSVTVTGAGGCTSSCSRTLVVNNPPDCNILPGNQTICAGRSASFTATGGGTYLWSTGATSASISNVTAAGTYSVTVTSAQGCTSSCSRTLTVFDPPNCNILPANQTICSYQTASFTATGGGTYLWSTGATSAIISNLTAAGTYSVTVTGVGGCTSSCSRTLVVNDPPVCNILPGNQTICAGNSASFTATGGGTYLWSTGATSASISNVTAAGTYSVTVTSAQGCTSSCSRTLTVVTNPSCDISPGNQTICAGRSASFTATGGSTYLWSTGATSAVISNITAAGTYSVTVTAGGGCTSSCSRTLTVIDPPNCNILPANQTICSYQTASFTATGGGTYLWSTGATSAIISNLTAAGTYSVTVTGVGGCTSSCSRTLTVNNPPDCNILPGNQTICAGSSASFTATGGTSYRWSTGATTAIINNVTAAGTYSVTVTAATGCTSSCSRTLTVNQNPSVDAGTNPDAQCRAAIVTNGSLVLGTNVFSVTGTVNAFTTPNTPAWSVKSDGGYNVSIVSPNSLTTNVNISGSKNGPGTVTLLLTGTSNAIPSCGTATDDVVLTIFQVPDYKPLQGSAFCPNITTTGSVSLPNSQVGVSYQLKDDGNNNVQAPKDGTGGTLTWFNLPIGSYTAIGSFPVGQGGCNTRTGAGTVIENPVPEVTITPVADQCNNVSVCAGLTAIPSGGTFSGTGVVGTDFCPNGLAPGVYTVTYTYTNTAGCTASQSTPVNVASCQAALCTYTMGYFGQQNGKSCDGTTDQLSSTQLINQSIAHWGGLLTIGCGTNKVTIATGQAQCVIDKMPGAGKPAELVGDYTICNIPDATMKNTLLGQTIALGLNIGITTGKKLGDFPLQAGTLYTAKPVGGCGSSVPKLRVCHYDAQGQLSSVENEYLTRSFSQALIDAIAAAGYPKTVGGLFSLASDALCNKDGVAGKERGLAISEIGGGAGSINEVFDECRISVGWNVGPCPQSNVIAPPRITVSASAEAATIGKLKVTTYPNPYRNDVRFVIESPVSGQAVLEVHNIAGQKIQTLFNGHIDANETRTIDYKPAVANGMMIYTLKIGNRQVTGKLIGLKQ